jgi:hypothetical protein
VEWLLSKLDAAESVWAAAAQAAGAAGLPFVPADYCLVPSGDKDMEFFCSEWSNEMLEAAGVCNPDDDFFKVCVCGGRGGRGPRGRGGCCGACVLGRGVRYVCVGGGEWWSRGGRCWRLA